MAAGVIVKTTTSSASTGLVRAAERALPRGVGLARVRKSASGGKTSVLPTSQRVTAADAEAVAAELRKRSDVVWAAPNYILRAFTSPPVSAEDEHFSRNNNRAVWDWRNSTDGKVRSVMGSPNSFGSGGFSSRAPYAWQSTLGQNAVVAVLDTGITYQEELNLSEGYVRSRVLPGYDFVSRYQFGNGTFEDTGRDGDGWDSNPQDRGDWEDAGYCYEDSPKEDSSWHGSHVSGIIAAAKDGYWGIVGVAPEAEILPVRVLGLCGGTFDDFTAAMRWSVGLEVTDPLTGTPVPINTNPADVINMSLGGYASCTSTNPDSAPMREAVAAVRATGAVVVAAAGNDGVNMSTHPVIPASCDDVIGVGATSEYGDRAGYPNVNGNKSVYSNYGRAVDVVAPGGDVYWSAYGGIISTVNSGTKSPSSSALPRYARYSGTSMAAPVVSGAAALLKSVNGDLTAPQTEAAVKASVQAFPRGTSSQFKPCSTSICGTGIIDLSKIQVPRSPTRISGTPIIGEPLTAVRGGWVRIPTSFNYQWLRDGTPIPNATKATYYPTSADATHALSVRMSPGTAAYSMFGSTSALTTPVQAGPQVTLTGLPSTLKYGVDATTTVTVKDGDTPVDGLVELRRGSTTLASGQTDENGVATIAIAGTQWVAGSNLIRAAFVGTPAASSEGVDVAVTKASSSVTTSLPTSVRYTSRATIGITVKVAGVPKPTGQLRIYDGSKKIVYAVLASSANGKRSIVLPRLSKGYHNIKVVYSGNSVISPKTSRVRKIRSY